MVACLKDVLVQWADPNSGVGCAVIKGTGGKVWGYRTGFPIAALVGYSMDTNVPVPDVALCLVPTGILCRW